MNEVPDRILNNSNEIKKTVDKEKTDTVYL